MPGHRLWARPELSSGAGSRALVPFLVATTRWLAVWLGSSTCSSSGQEMGSGFSVCIKLSWTSNAPDAGIQRNTEERRCAGTCEGRGGRHNPPSSQDSTRWQMPACHTALPLHQTPKTWRHIIKLAASEPILRTQPQGHELHSPNHSPVEDEARPI